MLHKLVIELALTLVISGGKARNTIKEKKILSSRNPRNGYVVTLYIVEYFRIIPDKVFDFELSNQLIGPLGNKMAFVTSANLQFLMFNFPNFSRQQPSPAQHQIKSSTTKQF